MALFESAHVYRPAAPLGDIPEGSPAGRTPALERHHLAALTTEARPAGWRTPAQPADFYAARALLEALLGAAGLDWWTEAGGRPFLHPGRAASLLAGDERKIGWLGELHPLVAGAWDLSGPVAAFELDVEAFPPSCRTSQWWWPTRYRRRRSRRPCARAAASCS